jgi:hypothetical protein
MVAREVLLAIDTSEARIAAFAGVYAIVLAAIALYMSTRHTIKHVVVLENRYDAIILAVGAACFLLFRWRQRRVGLVVVGLMLALALGGLGTGLPFLAFAGWLLLRAWRLQRFGTAGYGDTVSAARAQAKARREGKIVQPPSGSLRKAPQPSKRYTPKKPTPRRGR